MNVLIVDDNYAKIEEIVGAISSLSISKLQIEHASTAHAARVQLRNKYFDMLVIDLHLPSVVGAKPSTDGGIDLFDILCLDEEVYLPTDVLFITGRQDLLEEATEKIMSRGAQLCYYSSNSDLWRHALVGRARYLAKRLSSVRGCEDSESVDIVVVTALQTPELREVLKLPYAWRAVRSPNDPTTLHHGSFARGERVVKVVAACAQRKGMPSTAALASRLTVLFRPRYLVMLGICAGIRNRSRIGDVIVADPTWDWGAGKHGELEDGSPVFLAAPYQASLNAVVSQLARDLAVDHKVLASIRAGWEGQVPAGSLSVIVGPMASGASVIADSTSANSIGASHKELLAIEMEGYAVMAAADYAKEPKPVAIVIKSVCDFADPEKNDDWQSYAAYTSAAFANHLFQSPNFSLGSPLAPPS